MRAIRAASEFDDLPDFVALQDYESQAETATPIVNARFGRDGPGRASSMPYPKPGSEGVRQLVVMDPADQIAYRWAVGQLVDKIDKATGREVLSSRLDSGPPGWMLKSPRKQAGKRRDRLRARINARDFGGFGRTDVRSYYGSVNLSTLESALVHVGATERQASRVIALLAVWANRDGVRGLPIGPQASAPLGNVYLLPLDRLLRATEIKWTRYTDDLDLFVASEAEWEFVTAAITAGLWSPADSVGFNWPSS